MFSTTFYHGHLRKYVVLFGTLFNNIYINREKSGVNYDTIKVPISYGPKDKMLARVEGDPSLSKPFAIVLPRMSFEMTSLNYSPTRKLTTINKATYVQDSTDDERLKYVYNPVPYDINFSLYISVKNAEDGTRILEQILPYFTPDWTATINLVPELSIKHDIPTVLLNVSSEDTYEADFLTRRSITWTLDFLMKGYIYGPVKKSGIINLANVNFFTSNTTVVEPEERLDVTPGLLANGTGTTNATLTIARDEIPANSDFKYIVSIDTVSNE